MARLLQLLACLLVVSIGAGSAITRPATARRQRIDVIVHPTSGKTPLSRHQVAALLSRSQTTWDTGTRVVVLNLPPGSSLRVTLDQAVLGLGPHDVARFWLEKRIRGQGAAPRTVPNVRLMAMVVAHLRGSLGYLPHAGQLPGTFTVGYVENGRYHAGDGK